MAALRSLDLLDSAPESAFDQITNTLAHALDVPIALVSLIDCERQWFKSRAGLDVAETPRELAFCAHAILNEEPMVVCDARLDPRFAGNALVTGAPDIRFYAGMPVRAPDGMPIGTLCAIDRRPRQIDPRELAVLRSLASLVERELQHRAAAIVSRRAAADGEILFRSVFELAAVGIAIVEPSGRFARVNSALCDIVGYPAAELMRLSFQDITHPDDLHADLDQLQRLAAGDIPHYQIEKRYLTRAGAEIWVNLVVARRLNPDGSTHSFVSIIEDIGDRKAAEQQRASLAATLEREVSSRTQELRRMVEQTQRRNEQLRTLSEAAAMLTAANGLDEVSMILGRYLPQVFPAVSGAFYRGGAGSYESASRWGADAPDEALIERSKCWALRRGAEYRVEDPDDPLRCPHCGPTSRSSRSCMPVFALGECVGLISLEWDGREANAAPDSLLLGTLARKLGLAITNLRLREELRRQALHDPLTGLYNRRYLAEFMAAGVAESRRRKQGLALLMIDLDHFKALNDQYGHDSGDRALVEVASLLKRSLRAEEAAFRFGGEEFIIVLRPTLLDEARLCAERLRASIARLRVGVRRGGHETHLGITASVGVVVCAAEDAEAEALLAAADAALYQAKSAGRNRVVCADSLARVTSNAA
jgi:diguanylate cyclase (GGDEF)-like protein/PAS domain S-box-containing protein